jgi:hypothetical protein
MVGVPFGLIDRGQKGQKRNLLRPDTPTQVALVDVSDAPNAATQTQRGGGGPERAKTSREQHEAGE